jgi:hypothetical protein
MPKPKSSSPAACFPGTGDEPNLTFLPWDFEMHLYRHRHLEIPLVNSRLNSHRGYQGFFSNSRAVKSSFKLCLRRQRERNILASHPRTRRNKKGIPSQCPDKHTDKPINSIRGQRKTSMHCHSLLLCTVTRVYLLSPGVFHPTMHRSLLHFVTLPSLSLHALPSLFPRLSHAAKRR